jgi:hypothetical protein
MLHPRLGRSIAALLAELRAELRAERGADSGAEPGAGLRPERRSGTVAESAG